MGEGNDQVEALFEKAMNRLRAGADLDALLEYLRGGGAVPRSPTVEAFVRRHGLAIDDAGAAGLLQIAYAQGADTRLGRAARAWATSRAGGETPLTWWRASVAEEVEAAEACVWSRRAHRGSATGGYLLAAHGGRLMSAGDEGAITLWDVATGARVVRTRGPDVTPLCPRVEVDCGHHRVRGERRFTGLTAMTDRHVLARSLAGTVRIDLEARRVTHRMPHSTCAVQVFDDTVLLAESRALVWRSLATGHARRSPCETPSAHALCCHPDGRRVVLGTEDGRIRVWDLATGQAHADDANMPNLAVALAGRSGAVLAGEAHAARPWRVSLGADADTILACDGDTYVRFRFDGRGDLAWFDIPFTPWAPHVLEDPNHALVGGPDGVDLWDLSAGRAVARIAQLTAAPCDIAALDDGRRLAVVSRDGALSVWDWDVAVARGRGAKDERPANRRREAKSELEAVLWDGTSVTGDGRALAGVDAKGATLWQATLPEGAALSWIEAVPRQAWFLSRCRGERCVRLWDGTTGLCLHEFEVAAAGPRGDFYVFPSGLRAVVPCLWGARIIDLRSGEETRRHGWSDAPAGRRVPRTETFVFVNEGEVLLVDAALVCVLARFVPQTRGGALVTAYLESARVCAVSDAGGIVLHDVLGGRVIGRWWHPWVVTAIALEAFEVPDPWFAPRTAIRMRVRDARDRTTVLELEAPGTYEPRDGPSPAVKQVRVSVAATSRDAWPASAPDPKDPTGTPRAPGTSEAEARPDGDA